MPDTLEPHEFSQGVQTVITVTSDNLDLPEWAELTVEFKPEGNNSQPIQWATSGYTRSSINPKMATFNATPSIPSKPGRNTTTGNLSVSLSGGARGPRVWSRDGVTVT